jgi:hypothetical protein
MWGVFFIAKLLYYVFLQINTGNTMAKYLFVVGAIAVSLAGCGGGGSSSAPPAAAPVATTPAPISAPAISAKAVTVGAADTTVSGSGQDYLVKYSGTANLTVSGQIDNVWIADGQALGVAMISGTGNTVVFRPGSTVSTLNVGAAGNTIYLPVGSTIKVEGSGAAGTTVKFYTP